MRVLVVRYGCYVSMDYLAKSEIVLEENQWGELVCTKNRHGDPADIEVLHVTEATPKPTVVVKGSWPSLGPA